MNASAIFPLLGTNYTNKLISGYIEGVFGDVIVKRYYWRAMVRKGLTKLWRHFGLVSLVLHMNEAVMRQVDKGCTGRYH